MDCPALVGQCGPLILHALLYQDFWALTDWTLGPRFSMLCFFMRTVGSWTLHALLYEDSGVLDSPCPALWGQWGPGFSMLCFMGTVGSWILHSLLYGESGVLDSPCSALWGQWGSGFSILCFIRTIGSWSLGFTMLFQDP
jgi:hypothetical protein